MIIHCLVLRAHTAGCLFEPSLDTGLYWSQGTYTQSKERKGDGRELRFVDALTRLAGLASL